jgi:tetratricopeptide (TPR) repeat protein
MVVRGASPVPRIRDRLTHITRTLTSTIVVLLLAAGLALIGYARWTAHVADGDAALADGRLDQALAEYKLAEARFDALPAVRQAAASEYARVVGNHLLALYRLKHYDEVIDLAQRAPADAAPSFWSGSAFFQKAMVEEQPDARLGWLGRAEEEFRKAIEAAPDDWDTKFDFELTTRLAAELRKQPKTPPKQMMQLLRPPQPGVKTPRRVG